LVFKLLDFECGINIAVHLLWLRNEGKKEEGHDKKVAVFEISTKQQEGRALMGGGHRPKRKHPRQLPYDFGFLRLPRRGDVATDSFFDL